jgi:hypothetical protein
MMKGVADADGALVQLLLSLLDLALRSNRQLGSA